jgi:hypothetical protein
MTDSPADLPAQPDLATPLDPSPMPVNRQVAANRRNALRSTGPKTAAGKAVVRDNDRKHGFLSRHLITEGESPADFGHLTASMVLGGVCSEGEFWRLIPAEGRFQSWLDVHPRVNKPCGAR